MAGINDLRIALNSSSEVDQPKLLPSSTLPDIGQSGNNSDEAFYDQFLSSQTSSITLEQIMDQISHLNLKVILAQSF